MAATIQLRKGDMFAQPSDLIIIPCSTAATITSRVADQLKHFKISPPRKRMRPGQVDFNIFKDAANIATYVGYAASVEATTTTPKIISSVAEKVALFVKDKVQIRDVTLPLLGSGAGGLSPDASATAIFEGLERIPVKNKVYNIFVYDEDDFNELSRLLPEELDVETDEQPDSINNRLHLPKTREAIRVFISYTRTNVEHEEKVRDLAVYLRENGIDARLDIWHLRPGMDLPQWMSNELDLADRILIVCNEEYAARADGRIGGVGWEIRLVQGDLLQSQKDNPKKYIPIVFDTVKNADLPRFLRGVYAINWTKRDKKDAFRTKLLKELYEAYEQAPALGSPPRFVLR